jgi:hypothetical protein
MVLVSSPVCAYGVAKPHPVKSYAGVLFYAYNPAQQDLEVLVCLECNSKTLEPGRPLVFTLPGEIGYVTGSVNGERAAWCGVATALIPAWRLI